MYTKRSLLLLPLQHSTPILFIPSALLIYFSAPRLAHEKLSSTPGIIVKEEDSD